MIFNIYLLIKTIRLNYSGEKILRDLTAWPRLVLIVTGVNWGISASMWI